MSGGASPAELRATALDRAQSHYKRRDALRGLRREAPAEARSVAEGLLADPEKFLRREAAGILADAAATGDGAAATALAGVAADPDEDVRRAVVRALAAVGDAAHRPALVALVADRSYFVRRDAEEALQRLGAAPPAESRAAAAATVLAKSPPLARSAPLRPAPRLAPRPAAAPSAEAPIQLEPLPREPAVPPRRARAVAPAPLTQAAARILGTVRERTGVRDAAARREGAKPAEKILRIVREGAGAVVPRRTQTRPRVAAGTGVASARCLRCGWALRGGQKFCVFCGAPAHGDAGAVAPAPVASPVARPAPGRPGLVVARARPVARPAPSGQASGALGCGVVFAIVIGLAWLAWSGIGAAVRGLEDEAGATAGATSPVPLGQRARVILRDGATVSGEVVGRNARTLTLLTDDGPRRIERRHIAQEARDPAGPTPRRVR